MANQAIHNLEGERKATCELVELGFELIEQGIPSIPAEDMNTWMLSGNDSEPFPAGRASFSRPASIKLEHLQASEAGAHWFRSYYRRKPRSIWRKRSPH